MAEHFQGTVESLFKGMENFITTKTCVGDPIYVGDTQGHLNASREAGVKFVFASYGDDCSYTHFKVIACKFKQRIRQ